MSHAKMVGGFVLRSSVIFALFSFAWPGVGDGVSAGCRPLMQWWLSAMNGFRTVRVEPINAARGLDDAVFILPAGDKLDAEAFPFSIQQYAYTPLAMVASFVLATPLPWRRRSGALLLGAALSLTYTALRLEFALAYAQWVRWESLEPGGAPWLVRAFGFLHLAVFRRNAGTYVVPVLLWIAATFRRGDVQSILGRTGDPKQD